MSESLNTIFEALEFAAHKHQNQRRKGAGGIPYINHPIEVTKLLVTKMPDAPSALITAAILHDVLEDTKTSANEIVERFGKEVLRLVEEVSDDMRLSSATRKKIQVEKANLLSTQARCIKLADKTCNIRDMLFTRLLWPRQRKIDYVLWAIQVTDQIRSASDALAAEFDDAVALASEKLNYKFR